MRGLLIVTLLAGCGGAELGVIVDLQGVAVVEREAADELIVDITGDETAQNSFAPPAGRRFEAVERLVYRVARSSADLVVTVRLRAQGREVACGQQAVGLRGGSQIVTVVVAAGGVCATAAQDMGIDLSADPPDLAVGDMGGFSSCTTGGWLLCDGFDDHALHASWSRVNQWGYAFPDESYAYRGARSLHVHFDSGPAGLDGAPAERYLTIRRSFPPTRKVYVRAFVRVDANLGDEALGILHIDPMGSYLGADRFDIRTGRIYNTYKVSATSFPVGGWACVEAMFDGGPLPDAGGGSLIQLEYEGARLPELDYTDATVGNLNSVVFHLGFAVNPGDPPKDFWVDDLVISATPVGCTN